MLITIDSSWKAHGKIFKKNMLSVLELRSISSSQMVLLPHWYLITEGTPGRKHYFSKFKVTEKVRNNFWSLLTVHLSIILVTDQLNAPILVFIMTLLYLSTCFEHNRAHHQEVKIVSHSSWHHHTLQAAFRWTGWERTAVLTQPVHRTVACSVWWCQMLCDTILTSWWWARLCSKQVEEYNKLIIKQELVHYVGQWLKLYWDTLSAKPQNFRKVD